MRSSLRPFCATFYLLLVSSGAMSAQVNTYDEDALRIEGHHGDLRIIRGAEGTVVGKVGFFRGDDVAQLVRSSDRAALEARRFSHDYAPATWVLAVGMAALGANLGVSQIHDVNRGITTGLLLAGTGLVIYGAGRLERAYNALARSIWWYNRDLKD